MRVSAAVAAAGVAAITASGACAAPPTWSWAGFYLGAHAGAAWSLQDYQSADGALAGFTPFERRSVLGGSFSGAQAGYDWQFGPWIVGPEVSGSWADILGSARCGIADFVCTTKIDWFGSIAARVGYAQNRLLYYAKAGAAVVRDLDQITSPFFINVFNGNATRWGPTVGGGIEYAFTPSLSGFVEYDFSDFGSKTMAFVDQFGLTSNVGTRQNLQAVKIGVNYRPWGAGQFDSTGGSALPTKTAPVAMASDWSVEAGTRYWLSSGKVRNDLFDPFITTQLNSRLTYGPQTGNSIEAFARFDHSSGLFVKGFIGYGVLGGGNLQDEDFPPVVVPYSSTNSNMNGRIDYGALDVGHLVWKNDTANLGAFVGYRQYNQVSNAYGCAQTAANPTCVPAIPVGFLALTDTEDYRGIGVGLNGNMMVTDRVKLSADAAYLPYVNLSGFDNHWFRADINPWTETGWGWGTQLEGIVSYAMTDRWSVGLGARYWYFSANHSETEFPGFASFSPMKFYAQRFGGFLQTSYKFDGSDLADSRPAPRRMVVKALPVAPHPAADWTGLYFGAHIGGGWGTDEWDSATGTLGISGANFPGNAELNGVLAGGQVGYNYQVSSWVFGAQADASVSNFAGTAKCATFAGPDSGTCANDINRVGTITGRVGETYGKFLFYTDGGAAWAHDVSSVNALLVGPLAFVGDQTRWGWTIGGGVAYALTLNWSVFGEYDFMSFGTTSEAMNDATFGQSNVGINERIHVVKAGLNYKVDWASLGTAR